MSLIKTFTSKETFFVSNAIVNSRLPERISTVEYINKFKDVSRVEFGLFDCATPDYSTYYPEVSAEDLEPKDEDFYTPVVRALSRIILNKYGPIDFSEGSVLKDSTELLTRQSLYANHEVLVGNELGSVSEAVWQNSFVDTNGNLIPGGINARLKIDGKSNPRLVRGMRMDPPSIHSFSVGVTFDWEKSHPKMESADFWAALGTFGRDGKLVRRIVSNVQAYHELSLVPHGADPYAQTISDKGINNADYARRNLKYPDKSTEVSASFSFSEGDFKKFGHFIDYNETATLSIPVVSSNETIPNTNNSNFNNNSGHMDELQEFLDSLSQVEALGLSNTDLTAESALGAIKALSTNATKVENLNATVASLQAELDKAKEELTGQEPKVKSYEAVLEATKQEATRLYNLCKGDKASTEMLELIAKADNYNSALVFLNQFKNDAEGQFAGKCEDCGSSKVTRMSLASGDSGVITPSNDSQGGATTSKTHAQVFDSIIKQKTAFNAEGLHGKTD